MSVRVLADVSSAFFVLDITDPGKRCDENHCRVSTLYSNLGCMEEEGCRVAREQPEHGVVLLPPRLPTNM